MVLQYIKQKQLIYLLKNVQSIIAQQQQIQPEFELQKEIVLLHMFVVNMDMQVPVMDFAVFVVIPLEQLIQSLIHQFHIVKQKVITQCIVLQDMFISNQ